MFDLISIGDAVIDTFIPLTEVEVLEKEGEERKLCLRFGDKIPVGPSTSLVAGNAANNAVGAARLGLKTAIYVNVGNDPDGQRIKNTLKSEGIDPCYVIENKGLPSNHHVVLNFQGERTILIYHEPWQYQLPDLESCKWLYLTSLSPSFVQSNLMEQLLQYLERSHIRMLYNPGTFQIKLGVKKYPRLLSLTELLIINKEEARTILEIEEGKKVEIKKLLKSLLDLGPSKVIITDGEDGSYGADKDKFYQLAVFPAKLVEMTGSGDAYATGCLAGLFYGKDFPEAMRWGAANGAAVIEEIGPQKGLLTHQQMLAKLGENHKIVAKEI